MNDMNDMNDMNENTSVKKIDKKAKNANRIIILIFSLVIALVCFAIFIFNYKYAVSTAGDYIPAYFGVVFYYFVATIGFVIAAVMVKAVLGERIKLKVLVLIAVLLPAACYQFNYMTMREGGALYPLVDEGGIFYFIRIQDWNFDGMNDEEHRRLYEDYHRLYDERTYSSQEYVNNPVIHYVRTVATGVGLGLEGTSPSCHSEDGSIYLRLHKEDVTFKEIVVEVCFQTAEQAAKATFYVNDAEFDAVSVKDTIVTLTFDEKKCAEFQANGNNDNIRIPLVYLIKQ